MSRSRPTIDVSAHLIEPGPADPRSRPSPSTGSRSSATIIRSSSRSGRARGCSWSTPPGRTPARTSSGSSSRGSMPGSRPSGWPSRAIANARVWAGDARDVAGAPGPGSRASAPSTSISPTRGGRSGTRSAGSSPRRWSPRSSARSQPGGELHVASDVEEYFALIRELIAASPGSTSGRSPRSKDPEHDLDYLTNFERKYRLEGRPIYRAIYRLSAGAGQLVGAAASRRGGVAASIW